MTTATLPDTTADRALVPLSSLREHPQNPRPKPKKGDLDELAASILSLGILVPLTVRPVTQDGKALPKGSALDHLQVLAGHRRLGALRMIAGGDQAAKLDTGKVPVLVRYLGDAEALEVLLAENAHHQDVDPFLEGKAVDVALEAHGGDVRVLAQRLGLTPRWVAVRRNLKNLSQEWADRLRHRDPWRTWPTWVGELLATLAPDAQDRLFRENVKDLDVAGGPPPRSWWDATLEAWTRTLGRAPFDVTDEDLVAAAGACGRCPFTSLSQPGLFDDGSPDGDLKAARCLNAPCWDRKVAVDAKRRLEALRKKAGGQGFLAEYPLAILPQDRAAACPKGLGTVLRPQEYVKAVEGQKGAVPAVDVTGPMERWVWVRPSKAGLERLTPKKKGAAAADAPAPAPADQLRVLEAQHQAKVAQAAAEALVAAMRKRQPALPVVTRMAAVFGAVAPSKGTPQALRQAASPGNAGDRQLVARLWKGTVGCVQSALLFSGGSHGKDAPRLVAKVLGLEWKAQLARAAKLVKPARELEAMRASVKPPASNPPNPAPKDPAPKDPAKGKPAARAKRPAKGKAKPKAKRRAGWTSTDARMLKLGRGKAKGKKPKAPADPPLTPKGGLTPEVVSGALTLAACPDGKARDAGDKGQRLKGWTRAQLQEAYDWAMREHLGAADNPVKRRPCPELVKALPPFEDEPRPAAGGKALGVSMDEGGKAQDKVTANAEPAPK